MQDSPPSDSERNYHPSEIGVLWKIFKKIVFWSAVWATALVALAVCLAKNYQEYLMSL